MTLQLDRTLCESIFSGSQGEHRHEHQHDWEHRHTPSQTVSLVDLLLQLPEELFCHHIWPLLSGTAQRALFGSCKAMRQLIASHFATSLVLPIDRWRLTELSQPPILPRARTATKLTAMYICFFFYGDGRHKCPPTQLHLTDAQTSLLADTLQAASQQTQHVSDLTVDFAGEQLCDIMGCDGPPPLVLTVQLLSAFVCNLSCITTLHLSNFTTTISAEGAEDEHAPLPTCSLDPLQHAPNLVSISFQQEGDDQLLTWDCLCTLPLLLKLERLELSSMVGEVTQPFPHSLPALTHVAFTSRDTSAYSKPSQMELLRHQYSVAVVENIHGLFTQTQGVIAGLHNVKHLTVVGHLTRSLAMQLSSVIELCADGFRDGLRWDQGGGPPMLPCCKKLRILKFEIETFDLDLILHSFPCLEHLEAAIFLYTDGLEWQDEIDAYFEDRSSGFFGRLRDSGLKYLRLELVQSDVMGVIDAFLLGEVTQIASEFPFKYELTTISLDDFVDRQEAE